MVSKASQASDKKKKILVHIGTHKTGTTSIQVEFAARRKELLSQGVLYPSSGCPEVSRFGHHMLPWSVIERPNMMPMFKGKTAHFSKIQQKEVWKTLLAEIQDSNCHTIVVSSEEFDALNRSEIRRALDYLEDFIVIPVLFVRNTADLMESSFRTSVVYSGDTRTIHEYCRNQRARLDYSEVISDWTALNQGQAGIVLNFDDPVVRRDVVQAFIENALVGLDFASRTRNENESVPTHLVEIARFMRNKGLNEERVQSWIAAMRKSNADEKPIPTTLIDLELRTELNQAYKAEFSNLVATHHMEPFDIHSTLERKRSVFVIRTIVDALLCLPETAPRTVAGSMFQEHLPKIDSI